MKCARMGAFRGAWGDWSPHTKNKKMFPYAKKIQYAFAIMALATWCRTADADTYDIKVDIPAGSLHIAAHLDDISEGEKICLPAFGQRFGEHFYIGASQPPLVQAPDTTGCFQPGQMHALDLSYTLTMDVLPHGRFWTASNLSPVHADGWMAWPGEALFIERNTEHTHKQDKKHIQTSKKTNITQITVQNIDTQKDVASTLESHPNGTYIAQTPFELTRSFWTFGQTRVRHQKTADTAWTLSSAPDWPPTPTEYAQILDEYARWMPAKTPARVTLFLFTADFDADYRHGFARPGGVILQMGKRAATSPTPRRILLAHELFHLYNGESLKFDPQKYKETSWFREGMTQYLALASLMRLGLLNSTHVSQWMASSLESAPTHDESRAYALGYFISLAIDQQWRLHRTALSLQGFWTFLSHSPRWHTLHTNASLRDALAEYSAFDFSAFFDMYIDGTKKLPVDDILRLAGLCRVPVTQFQFTLGLEVELDPKSARLLVKNILPGGLADQSGLKIGDWIIPAKDTSWLDDSTKNFTVIRTNHDKDSSWSLKIPAAALPRKALVLSPCKTDGQIF